ncbi:MAG: hypothetical protein COU27_02270 [Candidatus Levybacteria bacterium CG10_big_fil_rev_8_21_14_0_10_36_7]|nr:MAG: hypothetical protein COU27_02270 [Candidatus Levybacteria bacterium CG10_big_fil_rev_8_21_14_0_10_36_7]
MIFQSKNSPITPNDLRGMAQSLGKKNYIPEDMENALHKTGFGKNSYRSATKRQALRAFDKLQEEGHIPKERTPKQLYEDLVAFKESKNSVVERPLSYSKLPKKLEGRNFEKYIEKADPRAGMRVKTILRQWGWTGQKELSKKEMKRALEKLNREGSINVDNIGERINIQERRRKANILGAVQSEIEEEERALPKDVQRNAIKEAPSSIFRTEGIKEGNPEQRTTSVLHGRPEDKRRAEDEESPQSSGSYFKRQGKKEPKSPGDKPDSLPDIFV